MDTKIVVAKGLAEDMDKNANFFPSNKHKWLDHVCGD
jgi:hypothetical protein